MSPDTIKGAAREAGDHPALEMAARIGYAVSGLLHLLIGWIALQVAWGSSGKSADQSGALASLAGNGVGRFGLWVAVLGFFGLAVWQVVEAVGGSFGEGMDAWAGRGKAVAKAVVYLVLGWTTLGFARGKHSSSRQQSVDFTASMLHQRRRPRPGRRIGLVVIGVGGYHVYKGATKRFLRDLVENPGTAVTRAGQVGYIAKGIALAIVGLLFVVAGVTRRAGAAERARRRAAHPARPAAGAGAADRRGRGPRGVRRLQLRPGALREGLTGRARRCSAPSGVGGRLVGRGGRWRPHHRESADPARHQPVAAVHSPRGGHGHTEEGTDMHIEYLHDSKYGNGAQVAEEFRTHMAQRGVDVDVHHIRDVDPRQVAPADLYVFSSPGRMGKPRGNMRRFLKKLSLPAGTRYAVLTTEGAPAPTRRPASSDRGGDRAVAARSPHHGRAPATATAW